MAINLFQSSTISTFNPFNNNSTPIPTSNNNFHPQVSGSYRGTFKTEKITYAQIDHDDQNTNKYTTNVFMQQEYKGISALQIRLEDYYLIRSQQIQDHHKSQIETAVRKNSFNPKMIRSSNQQNLKPPQFQDQSDIFNRSNNLFNKPNDHIKQSNNNQNIFNNPSNNNKTDILSNNSNDLFNKNNNPNIFKAPPSTNQMNNNNNNQSTNLFQQQNNSNSNNIFQQNNRPNNQGNNNIFNQSNNNFNQQKNNNNNNFNNQNLFSNNNNNINNSNNLFNQSLQPIQPALFQYPINTNNNLYQPMIQASLLGSLDYLKYQENQFKDFTRLVDSQIIIMEQQKQASLDEYDSMLRDSVNINFDYRLQNQYTQSMKSNKSYKLQNQKSSNLNNKTITSRHDKKTISTFQPHSLNTETKSIFNREDRKPISKFQENYQNTDSKCDFKSFAQRDDRKSQSIIFLDLEIIFLESEKFLSISQQFQNKSRINNVKQFVEEQLQNIEIFGSQSQQYFNNCLIYNNTNLIQDYNILLSKLTNNKLTFNYFYVKLPKLINDGYQSNLHEFPDFRKVQNFTVSNKFGKIVWTQQTNIYYLDLDKIIDIKQESIEVYDTTKINELLKPEIGVKLNSESQITFKFQLKNSQINEAKFKSNLINQAQKQGLQFMSIDFQNYEYTVKAFHFSGYHFNSDYSNTDNQNYQDQQQQVEIQTNNDGISLEQEENDSLSLEYQNERTLQFKQKFDINFQNMTIQEKQINYKLSNEIINKYNQRITQKFVIPQNNFQQNEQLQIDIQLLQNYFNNQQQSDQIKNTQNISMLLLDCIYQFKSPSEEIIRSFQLLNILFGNSTIDIVHFLQLQSNNLISLQDIDKNPKIKNIRGLRLSLFLEQFKIYQTQVELREQLISQQQTQNQLSNVFLSLNLQPQSHTMIILNKNDWIDRFVDWRINRSQPQPLYEDQWWNELYNQQKDNQIASSQFAAFIYYLLKKTKQPSQEYKKLYQYLYNNIDTYTIILFNIILRKQKTVSQQMKLIGRTIITKLLKSQVSNQLIFTILESFKSKVFQKEELIRIKSLIEKIGYFNSISGKDLNDIDLFIDKKQFLSAVKIIIEKNLENQYYQILDESILPYLVISDYYNENDLRLIIKHIINFKEGNQIINIICQMYLQEIEMNEILIQNWITKNEYQYHMKQIILKICYDSF